MSVVMVHPYPTNHDAWFGNSTPTYLLRHSMPALSWHNAHVIRYGYRPKYLAYPHPLECKPYPKLHHRLMVPMHSVSFEHTFDPELESRLDLLHLCQRPTTMRRYSHHNHGSHLKVLQLNSYLWLNPQ